VTVTSPTRKELEQQLATLRQQNAELEQQLALSQQAKTIDGVFFTYAIDMLSIIGFDGSFKRVNKAWIKQLGYAIEELEGQPFIHFVHPDDIERSVAAAASLQKPNTNLIAFENRYRHKDGSYRTMLWTCSSDPERQEFYSVTLDVTEQRITERERDFYVQVMKSLPSGLAIYHLADVNDSSSLVLVAANEAAERFITGDLKLSEQIGRKMTEIYPNIAGDPALDIYANVVRTGKALTFEQEYRDENLSGIFSILSFALPHNHLGILYEDITERKMAEEAMRQSIQQEEVIRAQKLALEELSTPLIPISDKIVIMPLIGSMDTRRAQQVMDTLLHGISATKATNVIIDITGVTVVDTQVANAFVRAAQAVRLLGAEVMITGIRPEVAQTLIGLGVDLSGIATSSSLQSGIARVFNPQ
jgi:rsbT co-antagonist protein RsbR